MAYRMLFILVEGDDDERFFDRVIKPMIVCEQIYDYVQLWKYAQAKKQKVNGFLRSINAMQAEYLFVSDMDESPCVTDKKARIASKFEKLSEDRILIVCREIESWYLAGLNDEGCSQIGIPPSYDNTDRMSKERFDDMVPKKFVSRIDFMQEIMKVFDQNTALTRNTSFGYFMRKYERETR